MTEQQQQNDSGIVEVTLNLSTATFVLPTEHIKELYFIEDIFNYVITGKIVFQDTVGITEWGPLTGNEIITVVYGKKGDRSIAFKIHKIGNIQQMNSTQPTSEAFIELYLVDLTFEIMTRKRYSRSWNQEKPSDIVKHITNNYLGEPDFGEFEDTINKIDFISPYWTPLKCIKYLSSRSIGSNFETPGYVYYHNTNQSIVANFCTLDYLLSSYNKPESKNLDELYFFETENMYYINKIMEWWISGVNRTALQGLKGGHRLGFDFEKKMFLDRTFTYKDSISKFNILGRKSLFEDISDETTNIMLTGCDNNDIIDSIYYNEWLRRYLMQNILNIVVRGDEERYAGKQIEIVWPGSSGNTADTNKQLKGYYLIKSVTHHFTFNSEIPYTQRLVCIKNGYEESDSKELVVATKQNIAGAR